ncbi:hypothetical protein VZT92_006505 [Zoarces viviparus]|uniref:Uncharacterized protein n=1 Tax=Zoarces viviparus TaxID=48416 RepID=A0AAW1FQG2_ZOAVI
MGTQRKEGRKEGRGQNKRVALTASSSLQHLCPCGGGVPGKRKPPRQPGTSQMPSVKAQGPVHPLVKPRKAWNKNERTAHTRASKAPTTPAGEFPGGISIM